MSDGEQASDGAGEPGGTVEEQAMTELGLVDDAPRAEPVAVGPGDLPHVPSREERSGPERMPVAGAAPVGALDAADASLLALVDRLAVLLERSDLGELEVASGGTTIVLRSPSAIERQLTVSAPAGESHEGPVDPALAADAPTPPPVAARPSVKAPLTGIFYGAPSPGATAYVTAGDHVAVGQIIGLIEAMKLFNEIKSDLAGRVVRVCADNGALVKAKQALVEVDPA
jgi:acetyl-CoA carboxylase biotin carboxyl carrier protein